MESMSNTDLSKIRQTQIFVYHGLPDFLYQFYVTGLKPISDRNRDVSIDEGNLQYLIKLGVKLKSRMWEIHKSGSVRGIEIPHTWFKYCDTPYIERVEQTGKTNKT